MQGELVLGAPGECAGLVAALGKDARSKELVNFKIGQRDNFAGKEVRRPLHGSRNVEQLHVTNSVLAAAQAARSGSFESAVIAAGSKLFPARETA
jgi:hypothetical protein